MKKHISFLFFILLSYSSLIGQQQKDSTEYYLSILTYPKKENDLAKAYQYLQEKQKKAFINNDSLKITFYLQLLANVEYKIGLYSESEQTAIEALKFQEGINNKRYLVSLYNHLGKVNRTKKDYQTAIRYYKKIEPLKDNSLATKMTLYNNLGVVYLYQKNIKNAISSFQKSYTISLSLKDSLKIAKALDNLGYAQSKLNIDSGFTNMKKALAIRQRKNKPTVIYTSYKHFFNYYFDRKKEKKALQYATLSYNLATQINSLGYKLDALQKFVKLGKKSFFLEYINLRDSIDVTENFKRTTFISAKYNYTQQELKAKKHQLKAEKQKQLKRFYQLLVIVAVILFLFIYSIYNERNKKKIVENIIQTEGRISKTIHDVIANDIYQIMTQVQSNKNDKNQILKQLDKVYEKARTISRDHNVIQDEMNLTEIFNDLFESYCTDQVNIIPSGLHKMNWDTISVHKKNMLYRVLKELMTNMLKYSKASLVAVQFHQKKKNKLTIIYKDNGIGCTLHKKNGLVNAENRIKSIGGKIIFESEPNKGFKVKITI